MAEPRYEETVYERVPGDRTAYARSIPGILSDLLTQFTTLIKQESELARTEMSEKISRAIMGIVLAGAAAVMLIPALVILLMAGVYGIPLVTGWPMWASALVVGGGVLLIGLILLAVGLSRLRNLTPNKTIQQLQEDAAMARRQARSEPVAVETVETDTVRRRNGYERAA